MVMAVLSWDFGPPVVEGNPQPTSVKGKKQPFVGTSQNRNNALTRHPHQKTRSCAQLKVAWQLKPRNASCHEMELSVDYRNPGAPGDVSIKAKKKNVPPP